MVVHKVLNNNIVSSLDERGREVLLVGRGLGWQAKPGETVDRKKIDKIFRMDTSASTEKLKQLFWKWMWKSSSFLRRSSIMPGRF